MAETPPDRTTGTLPVEPPGQSLLRRRPLPVPGDRGDPCHGGRSKSIVVLGAGDPLARRVTRALIASGHDVTIAGSGDDVREPSGASRRVIRWEDPDALRRAVVSHDAVVNLEPVIGEPRSTLKTLLDRPGLRRRARQLAMLTRAFAGAPAARWIQRSTPALYCDGGERWLDEDWPIDTNPLTEHAHCAEQAVSEHVGRGGTGVVLRLARPYGPDDPWTNETLRLARKGWQPFEGPDRAFAPTVSLIDATTAVVAALEAPPGVHSVADPVPYSAFTNVTGWNPRLGLSAIVFVPSTRPLARLDTR